jgi:hypothetical protein
MAGAIHILQPERVHPVNVPLRQSDGLRDKVGRRGDGVTCRDVVWKGFE